MTARNIIAGFLSGLLTVCLATRAQEIGKRVDSIDSAFEQRACEYVRGQQGFTSDKFLRAARREDFEDDLFVGQIKIRGQIHKAARFFEVTETGYEIVSPDEAVFHSSTNGSQRWIVAIGSTSGRIYGLAGFDNSTGGFNQLAEDSMVRITSQETATSWANFFLATAKKALWLSGPLDLQRAVEDIIAAHALTRKHPISASQWLKSLGNHQITPIIGVKTRKSGGDYEVAVDSVSTTNQFMPLLKETRFRILANGVVAGESVANLFPLTADTK